MILLNIRDDLHNVSIKQKFLWRGKTILKDVKWETTEIKLLTSEIKLLTFRKINDKLDYKDLRYILKRVNILIKKYLKYII